MQLSVITVTYNSERFIEKYLESVLKFLPRDAELIIVDSGSEDKTVQQIYPSSRVKLIIAKENIGFGKGNNLAAKQAKGDYLFILNPDTRFDEDPFTKLIKFAKSHPKAGIIAPKLIEESGQAQPSVRKLPTTIGALKEYYFGISKQYEAYVPEDNVPRVVESVVGAAILIKKDLFFKLGGFDEKYFMYFEDLDLCRKVLKAGFKIYFFPQIKIYHKVGGTVTYPEENKKWLKDSAKKYHGISKAFVLDKILKFRPLKR